MNDDHKLSSTMSLNMPTSREYGRFTFVKSRYSSSIVTTSRDENIDSNDLDRHDNYPGSLNKINEKSFYTQPLKPSPSIEKKKNSGFYFSSEFLFRISLFS